MNDFFARHRRSAGSVLGVLGLLVAVSAASAEEKLPTAREVLDRYVEVTNAGALEKHDTMITEGTFAMPAQGMSGKVTVWNKAPDKFLVRIELPGFGEVLQGYDGQVGWSLDPAQGPQLMQDEALAQTKDQANFYTGMYRAEDLQSAELVGKSEFEGEAAYELKIVTKHGSESTQYFSVESGLLIGRAAEQHTPMGAIPSRTVLSDYKEFGEMMAPTKLVDSIMGMQQVMTIDSITHAPIEDEKFALPAAVAALTDGE